MRLIVRWDLSTIPTSNGMWVHQNHICTPHVRANLANLYPQNAAPLSVSSSIDGLLSQNTTSSCLMILAESWQCKGFQMAKWLRPQSINVRYSCCPKWVTSIATLFQFSATLSLPSFQCTGAGSINWHSLQSLTNARTLALVTLRLISLTKYSVLFTPGLMNGLCVSNVSFFSNSTHRLSGFHHCTDFLQSSLWHP